MEWTDDFPTVGGWFFWRRGAGVTDPFLWSPVYEDCWAWKKARELADVLIRADRPDLAVAVLVPFIGAPEPARVYPLADAPAPAPVACEQDSQTAERIARLEQACTEDGK